MPVHLKKKNSLSPHKIFSKPRRLLVRRVSGSTRLHNWPQVPRHGSVFGHWKLYHPLAKYIYIYIFWGIYIYHANRKSQVGKITSYQWWWLAENHQIGRHPIESQSNIWFRPNSLFASERPINLSLGLECLSLLSQVNRHCRVVLGSRVVETLFIYQVTLGWITPSARLSSVPAQWLDDDEPVNENEAVSSDVAYLTTVYLARIEIGLVNHRDFTFKKKSSIINQGNIYKKKIPASISLSSLYGNDEAPGHGHRKRELSLYKPFLRWVDV